MRIKTRLRVNSYFTLAMLLLMILVTAWSLRRVSSAEQNVALVNNMQKMIFERTVLRDEYLLRGEERPRVQYHVKSEQVMDLLRQASERFKHRTEEALLEDIRRDVEETLSIFSRLVENRAREKESGKAGIPFQEAEKRLVSQILARAYTLIDRIGVLLRLAHGALNDAQERSVLFVFLFSAAVVFAIIGNSVFINRIMTKRIEELRQGIEIIGAGNLDHCIPIKGDDELSDLARSNNAMAARLKQSYASLEDLQNEIAERKRVEDHLQKALADLERSNKELEQFAYVASHDLQEPLRMVSSYTQLLAERYEGRLDEKADKYIAYAVDGAVRMQQLINDLLSYSRVGTRGKPLGTADTRALLDEAIRNLGAAIEKSRAAMTVDGLPSVQADPAQLVQLFQNLLSNAIKFKGEDVPRVHVSARDAGHEWVFAVCDNGIGIEPRYADRVFVIFQRLHTRLEYPGTGIGLAVCKRIVERHGGRIWFESEPGKGSTFYFSLPKQGKGGI